MLKEDGVILTRSVSIEFSRLPLLVLGDENITFPWAQEDVIHGGFFPPASRRRRGEQNTLLGPDIFQVPSAKSSLGQSHPATLQKKELK